MAGPIMKVNLKLLAAQLVVMPAIYGLVLFLAAGTAAWPAGWIYLILFFGSTSAMSLWLLKNNPGFADRAHDRDRPNRIKKPGTRRFTC